MQSLEYQLGYFVGEYIYHTQLPTLSTDMIRSNHVIYVSDQETYVFNDLETDWHNNSNNEEQWIKLVKYRNELARKYLPETLPCYVPKIFIGNKGVRSFKDGVRSSLWNTDLCWYAIEGDEDIVIDNDDTHFTIITFKLELNEKFN